MAYVRAVLLGLVILGFVLAMPLQWLVLRLLPVRRHEIPMLFHRALCAAVGLRVRVSGVLPRNLPVLVIANHVSWLDIPALGSQAPTGFLAKREVGQWPLIGNFARLQGCVFVDRTRKRSIPQVNRQIASSLLQANALVIFPEATTGDGNRLMQFYSPHFQAAIGAASDAAARAILLQTVTIVYTHRNGLPYDCRTRPGIAWYGDMALLPHLWDILRGGPMDCRLTYGAARRVNASDNRKQLAAAARQSVREMLADQRRGGSRL